MGRESEFPPTGKLNSPIVTEDNDGNYRAIVYNKIHVEKDDDPETPYTLFGVVGNAVCVIKKFKDQKSTKRELLHRCGVSDIMIAVMELTSEKEST